jgi:hypothetical protein
VAVIDATRELISDAAEIIRRHTAIEQPAAPADPSLVERHAPLRVLGYAVNVALTTSPPAGRSGPDAGPPVLVPQPGARRYERLISKV